MNKLVKPLAGVTTEHPVSLLELDVIPDGAFGALAVAPHTMEQKRFQRQYTLLEGYICLALGRLPDACCPVKLKELPLPQEEDSLGKAAVWFSHACRSEDPCEVIMAVYNGLGALPGGYPQVQRRAELFLETVPDFLSCVQAARREEDDPNNGIQPLTVPDLNVLRQGLLEACRAEASSH